MTRTHVGTLDPEALGAAFLRVYENYVVPVQMTPEWLARHLETNDVDREASPLWIDPSGQAVALGLLGVRGARGWIGGFGVAVDHRGKGLSRALARDMLDRSAALGLAQVQLEVITQNEFAIKTYRGAGFEIRRDLLVYVRPADASPHTSGDARVHAVDADLALAAAVEARGEGALPGMCWQREPASMLGRGELEALAIGAPGEGSYLLYGATPTGLRIAALWASGDGDVATLVAALIARHPNLPVSLLNEPEESPYRAALEQLGFVERLRQHEMVVPIRS
jgi:RimJ/RimL family protein N-acetyltransferase